MIVARDRGADPITRFFLKWAGLPIFFLLGAIVNVSLGVPEDYEVLLPLAGLVIGLAASLYLDRWSKAAGHAQPHVALAPSQILFLRSAGDEASLAIAVWEVPQAWFNALVGQCLEKFGKVYIIQPYREQEKCAPACWNAVGDECQCSCMGEHHGMHSPADQWKIVSDTFATSWGEQALACRLVERKTTV